MSRGFEIVNRLLVVHKLQLTVSKSTTNLTNSVFHSVLSILTLGLRLNRTLKKNGV